MKYYAIIVAGGSGKRMDNTTPKQFLLLNGQPLIFYTLRTFFNCALKPAIILVLNKAQQTTWKSLCTTYNFNVPHLLADGGEERFFSVKNALDTIKDDGIIAIHDAVRPLVSDDLVLKVFEEATKKGNAIAAVQPSASVRYKGVYVNREEVMLIQTPQAFDVKTLKAAYTQAFQPGFTDDASVAEANGLDIHLVEGENTNIKITWPADLAFAESVLKKVVVGVLSPEPLD